MSKSDLIQIPDHCQNAPQRLDGYVHDVSRKKSVQREKLMMRLVNTGQAEYIHAILSTDELVNVDAKSGGLLCAALKRGHEDVIDVLLHHGADTELVPEKAYVKFLRNDQCDKNRRLRMMRQITTAGYDLSNHTSGVIMPMFKPYFNKSFTTPAEELLTDLFDLGADYLNIKRGCLNANSDDYANRAETYYNNYLLKYVNTEPPGCESEDADNLQQQTQQDNRVLDTPSILTPWEMLNNDCIAFVEKVDMTETTIQTIFNFEARNIKTIIQVAQTQPSLQITNFNEVEGREQLQTAFNKLCALGGNPSHHADAVPAAGNTLDKSVVKLPLTRLKKST